MAYVPTGPDATAVANAAVTISPQLVFMFLVCMVIITVLYLVYAFIYKIRGS